LPKGKNKLLLTKQIILCHFIEDNNVEYIQVKLKYSKYQFQEPNAILKEKNGLKFNS